MPSLWNRSGMIERQDDDIRAAGALAYFYNGGTTTPLTVYQDSGENSAHANPVAADANGRWPDVFVPYIVGYDVRVTTDVGVQLSFTQNIPNPDPVDVSVTIPPDKQVQTGMIHAEFASGPKAGYVRCNAQTIGNAVSGATERANADTVDLFTYLWNNLPDQNLAFVSGGRGTSAAADFAANKTISCPDFRCSYPVGIDGSGFGGVDVNQLLFASFFVGNATTPGSRAGDNNRIINASQLPAHSHTGTTAVVADHVHTGITNVENSTLAHTHNVPISLSGNTGGQSADHTHQYSTTLSPNVVVQGGSPSGVNSGSNTQTTTGASGDHTHPINLSGSFISDSGGPAFHQHLFTTGAAGSHSHTFTTDAAGGGLAISMCPWSMTVCWFIKL
jgi:hypothetical protein